MTAETKPEARNVISEAKNTATRTGMQQQKCFDIATESDHTSGVQAEGENADTRTRKREKKAKSLLKGMWEEEQEAVRRCSLACSLIYICIVFTGWLCRSDGDDT